MGASSDEGEAKRPEEPASSPARAAADAAAADGLRREARLSLIARLSALGALIGGLLVTGAVFVAMLALAGLLAIVGILAPGRQGRVLSDVDVGPSWLVYVAQGGMILLVLGVIVGVVAGMSWLVRRSMRAQRAADVASLAREKRR